MIFKLYCLTLFPETHGPLIFFFYSLQSVIAWRLFYYSFATEHFISPFVLKENTQPGVGDYQ